MKKRNEDTKRSERSTRRATTTLMVCLAALAAGAVQATQSGTDQTQVSAVSRTHTGAHYADHVTLLTGGGSNQTCPQGFLSTYRMDPDGQVPVDDFVVPAGKILVLTDFAVGFRERFGNDWVAGGHIISAQLRTSPPELYPDDTRWQTVVQIDSLMAAAEEGFVKEHLEGGVVIGSGQRPCLRVGFGATASANTVSALNLSKLYGYLVDE